MAPASFAVWIKAFIGRFQDMQDGPRRRTRRRPRKSLFLEALEPRDCPTALSQPFNPSDVLVVTGNTLNEYTTGGSLVQSFSVAYPGDRPDGEEARGVVVGPGGLAYVFNGTSSPYLSALDPATATWTHTTLAGVSLANDPGYGEMGQYQQYVFAPNMSTPDAGIVRFDTATDTATPFATSTAYNNVAVGLDGKLYAIRSSGAIINVYDPTSMNLLESVDVSGVSTDPRGVAVDAAGNIFTADWNGDIDEFDGDGDLLNSLNPSDGDLTSIALASDGQIIAGTSLGDLIVTDESLSSPSIFPTNESGTEAYVALVTPQMSPAVTSGANTTFTVGNAGSFTVQSIGSPTTALTEIGALPSGVTFTDNGDGTASLTGTPEAGTGGVYVFTITAQTDFGSDATQTFTLTVDEAPPITSAPPRHSRSAPPVRSP